MSKWEKLLEKIRNNPKTVTFDEVDQVMKRLGYDGKFSPQRLKPLHLPKAGSHACHSSQE